MGAIRNPGSVKLFTGILVRDVSLLPLVREKMEPELGPVDLTGLVLDFSYTRYYEPELGPDLKRQFWGFHRLVNPERLPIIKLFTNKLEAEFSITGRRRVNLDPGYLSEAKVVLASTKDYSHRLYLGRGIYGEVTLMYRGGDFLPLPWTYPDYRSPDYHRFFLNLRSVYRGQIQSASGTAVPGAPDY